VLARADGSAKWAQEGSAVLAAVHGPHQAGQRREDAERAVVEVLVKPRNGLAGTTAYYSAQCREGVTV
jgi:exosome complex component RRP46